MPTPTTQPSRETLPASLSPDAAATTLRKTPPADASRAVRWKQLSDDLTARAEALRRLRDELEPRRADQEKRAAILEQREQFLSRREVELDTRAAELSTRHAELLASEMQLRAREEAVAARCAAIEQAMREIEEQRATLEHEREAVARRTGELDCRAVDLARISEQLVERVQSLDERELVLHERLHELEKQDGQREASEHAVNDSAEGRQPAMGECAGTQEARGRGETMDPRGEPAHDGGRSREQAFTACDEHSHGLTADESRWHREAEALGARAAELSARERAISRRTEELIARERELVKRGRRLFMEQRAFRARLDEIAGWLATFRNEVDAAV